MILLDIIAWLLFLFLIYYVLLHICIITSSSKGRLIDIEKRSYIPKYHQNINVIVYSHNNASTIIDLVESLRHQEYEHDKYSINVILDNCDDNSSKLLEILGGTRLWRINTDIRPIGKFKAIAWLLERILSTENTNTFVFLDADCVVKPDFLSKINTASYDNPVLIGEVIPLSKDLNLMSGLTYLKDKIEHRVIKHGRFYAALGNILDSDICAINQNILEKINFSITDYGFEEYEFSAKLARANVLVSSPPHLYCFKQLNEDLRSLALADYKKRYKNFMTFKNNLLSIFKSNALISKELILSFIYPSSVTFMILSLILLNYSICTHSFFAQIVGIKVILTLILAHLFSKLFAMFVARCSFAEYKSGALWIIFAPIVFSLSLLQGLKIKMSFKFSLPKKLLINKDQNKQIIETTVTDGKKELPCKIEIRQNNDFCQVVFIFNDKKLTSAKYPRIDLALEELVEKLKSHGFVLKVCLNCGYFKLNENTAVKLGGEQGYCLFDNINKNSKAWEYSYIWNSCANIISVKTRKYIQQKLNEAEIETK